MDGSFGSNLEERIKKQIEVRQNLQGREENFVNLEKKYAALYQNAPWVCLRSSVDAPAIGTYKPGENNKVTSDVAKNFVLCGGTLQYFKQNGEKPYLAFTGEEINGRRTPGYTNDNVFGYRPRPGITKVSVKTKDTYGCIMEAIVDFVVYSVEELELIDQIYFKPGMSALLEWGHSVYLDNNGQLHNTLSRDLYSFPDFFGNKTFETIQEEVQEWRKTGGAKANPEGGTCGNYEVMYGYITNFSYSFNVDGSYSCTVKLLSKGSLLEGFQIPSNTGCRLLQTVENEQDSAIKSPFHRIFSKAEKAYENYTRDSFLEKVIFFDEWEKREASSYLFFGKNIIQGEIKKPIIYMSLDTFLIMVNDVIREAHVPDILFEVKARPEFTSYPYATFDEHFSLNPGVAILPCKADYHNNNYEVLGLSLDNAWHSIGGVLLMTRPEGLPQGRLQRGDNLISDIWVNIEIVKSHLDQIIGGGNQGKYNLRVLVESVLGSIQKALGNVNNFGIHINEVTGRAEIVDRNCMSSPENLQDDSPIVASGIKTTLKNLTVTSEISAEISSEMSIAATAPEDGVTTSNMDVVFWNEGCKDRHRPDTEILEEAVRFQQQRVLLPGATTGEQISSLRRSFLVDQERILKEKPFIQSKDFLEQVYYLYKVLKENNGEATEQAVNQGFSQYSETAFLNLQLEGETLFRRCIDRDLQEAAISPSSSDKVSSHFQAGIIPIKVSFTMKGIGRFLIGTTFKISEGLLPRKYKNWRHLITGIEHTIDKSGWYTTVTALYYPVVVLNTNPTGGYGTYTETDDTSVRKVYEKSDGNNPEYDYVERYPDARNFFSKFWAAKRNESSACARYVVSMAESWIRGYIVDSSAGGNAGDEFWTGSEWKSVIADTLEKKGWKILSDYSSRTGLSYADLRRRVNEANAVPGTILIYYSDNFSSEENGRKKHREDYGFWVDSQGYHVKNPSFMHVQMKAVSPGYGQGWTTSHITNYHAKMVYGTDDILAPGRKWKLWVLAPPEIHSNWKV